MHPPLVLVSCRPSSVRSCPLFCKSEAHRRAQGDTKLRAFAFLTLGCLVSESLSITRLSAGSTSDRPWLSKTIKSGARRGSAFAHLSKIAARVRGSRTSYARAGPSSECFVLQTTSRQAAPRHVLSNAVPYGFVNEVSLKEANARRPRALRPGNCTGTCRNMHNNE